MFQPVKDEENIVSPNEKYYFGPSRLLTKRIRFQSNDGTLDFTINGGEQFQPIYITSVVWNSQAYLQGMRPGDQIISINGIQLEKNLNYTQVIQILYSMREIDLIIRTLRVNALDATLYHWYDPIQQRSTSPPPSTYLSKDAQLPYFQKTVTVRVEKGKRLGLVIRGGSEYGLGIFISGVDKGSLSDQSGLRIGDQILSVNGIDFRHITHRDAVQLLRNIDQMTFHLRQMNKLPKPKDFPPLIKEKNSKRKFPNFIFNQNEKIQLENFLKDYSEENLSIDQFVQYFLQILKKQNEENRNEFIQSIRKFIRSNDFDRFDILILKDDLNTLKSSHERLVEQSSRMTIRSPLMENNRRKKSENLIRPQSLIFDNDQRKQSNYYSPSIERKSSEEIKFNSLRKSQSLHNVDEENHFSPMNKSLNNEQSNIIQHFLQDYSKPYPITIHKVRSTLGVAIEGGLHDRIPLPRIVYMQPDGCAYVSSGLRVGHVIVGLNGYSMKGLLHREAALLLASSFKDKTNSHMDLLVVEPLNDH